MQTPHPTEQTVPDLPSAAVDRVFARLIAIFGAQRMTASWGSVDVVERNAVWSRAIGRAVWRPDTQRFDLESVGAALDELAAEPTSWPPSSGEFADRCERFAQRPGRRLALPVPVRTAEQRAVGAERMQAMRATIGRSVTRGARADGRDWARRIVERAQRGDSALASATTQFAREALSTLPARQPGEDDE